MSSWPFRIIMVLKFRHVIPRSGHEKGNVENKVGYIRYNFFNKAPIMTSFEDLTVQLEKQLIEDLIRLHYEKNVLINELLEDEKKYLLQLPKVEYPVFKEEMGKVNKYNEIKLDQVLVHVPRASNYSLLHVQLTWNSVKVISPGGKTLHF